MEALFLLGSDLAALERPNLNGRQWLSKGWCWPALKVSKFCLSWPVCWHKKVNKFPVLCQVPMGVTILVTAGQKMVDVCLFLIHILLAFYPLSDEVLFSKSSDIYFCMFGVALSIAYKKLDPLL